jgi:hypothetical protein
LVIDVFKCLFEQVECSWDERISEAV